MSKGNGLVLGTGMRVLYQGELYNLIDMGIVALFNEELGLPEIRQTFFISKVEPATLDGITTLYEADAKEVTPTLGNDFWETSPYNIALSRLLGG